MLSLFAIFLAAWGTSIFIIHTIAIIFSLDPIWTILLAEVVGVACGMLFALIQVYLVMKKDGLKWRI